MGMVKEDRTKMAVRYDDFDPQCVELCRAINRIPGLETYASCCGHGYGYKTFSIWFTANDVKDLFILLRNINRSYIGFDSSWTCTAAHTDLESVSVVFLLSTTAVGENAYNEALKIAAGINKLLKNKTVLEMFKLKSTK